MKSFMLNQRSAAKPYVDDNRMFYLAADNDQDRSWVEELAQDVWINQLPAYRRFSEEHPTPVKSDEPAEIAPRSTW